MDGDGKIYLQEDCKIAGLVTPEKCYEQPAHAPVTLSNLNGFKVCGHRSGTNFLNARRAISGPSGDLTCSESGYMPCDYKGIAGVTYCVKQVGSGNYNSDCPITDIKLAHSKKEALDLNRGDLKYWLAKGQDAGSSYKFPPGLDNYIMYSKAGKNLPITSITLSQG